MYDTLISELVLFIHTKPILRETQVNNNNKVMLYTVIYILTLRSVQKLDFLYLLYSVLHFLLGDFTKQSLKKAWMPGCASKWDLQAK